MTLRGSSAFHLLQLVVIEASKKFTPLKKSKGAKRKEVDATNRAEVVATLAAFEDNDYARVFDKEYFYFNKQAIQLTNLDVNGNSFDAQLKDGKKSQKLTPIEVTNGEHTLTEFDINEFDRDKHTNLKDAYDNHWKPLIDGLDYREQPLTVTTATASYHYDADKETIVKTVNRQVKELGNGKIVVKASYSEKTKTRPASIKMKVELIPDYEKDYEIIDYHRDQDANQQAIADFMKKYISRPFVYLNNTVGAEINFNKVFYHPEQLRETANIIGDIHNLDSKLAKLEVAISL